MCAHTALSTNGLLETSCLYLKFRGPPELLEPVGRCELPPCLEWEQRMRGEWGQDSGLPQGYFDDCG